MIGLLIFVIGLLVSLVLALLPWLFGFFGGYYYGRAKGRQEMLRQRDQMEELARKQYGRFEAEHEQRQAADGRAQRAEFELQEEQSRWTALDSKYGRRKRKAKLAAEEWPEVIGDTDDNDDDVPTIG